MVQARAEREDVPPKRVRALGSGEHVPAIDLRPALGTGAEIVVTMDSKVAHRARVTRGAAAAGGARVR